MTVPLGQIGFYIKDRRTVHEIRPGNQKDLPVLRMFFDAQQPHRGQADGVGPEGRAAGEDSHPAVSPQTGRPHGRRPIFADGFRKFPDQPDMGKLFQPPQASGFRYSGSKTTSAVSSVSGRSAWEFRISCGNRCGFWRSLLMYIPPYAPPCALSFA